MATASKSVLAQRCLVVEIELRDKNIERDRLDEIRFQELLAIMTERGPPNVLPIYMVKVRPGLFFVELSAPEYALGIGQKLMAVDRIGELFVNITAEYMKKTMFLWTYRHIRGNEEDPYFRHWRVPSVDLQPEPNPDENWTLDDDLPAHLPREDDMRMDTPKKKEDPPTASYTTSYRAPPIPMRTLDPTDRIASIDHPLSTEELMTQLCFNLKHAGGQTEWQDAIRCLLQHYEEGHKGTPEKTTLPTLEDVGKFSFGYKEEAKPKRTKLLAGGAAERDAGGDTIEVTTEDLKGQLSIRTAPPRLPPFSGTDPVPKGEISFAQWKNDVNIYRAHTKPDLMTEAVRNSLRGQAADSVLSLGESNLDDILKELNVLYGVSFTFSMLEKAFCNIVQDKGESVASYASKLSSAFSKMEAASNSKITAQEKDRRLRDHFFEGLQKSIQSRLQFMMYQDTSTYADLRVAARTVEESDRSTSTIRLKTASVETEPFQKKPEEKPEDSKNHGYQGYQGKPHYQKSYQKTHDQHQHAQPNRTGPSSDGDREVVLKKNQEGHDCMFTTEGRPICHFCKIPGHISRECRKKKKFQEQNPNYQRNNHEQQQGQQAHSNSMQFPPMYPGGYYYPPPPQAYMHQMMSPQVQNTTFSNQGNGTGAVQQGMGRPQQRQQQQTQHTPTQNSN